MTHELLDCKDIVKNTTYNPRDPIATIFSAIGELLKFAAITGTSYTKLQDLNIAYTIIHRAVNFGLAIRNWNCMSTVQKTWIGFKQFFRKAH